MNYFIFLKIINCILNGISKFVLFLLYFIVNILLYNDVILRLKNIYKFVVVLFRIELFFYCGFIFCRLYIYIGIVFFFYWIVRLVCDSIFLICYFIRFLVLKFDI